MVRVSPDPGADDIAQVGDGVGGSGVFRQAGVIQVQAAGGQVDADVFQDGAELPGAFVDLRFGLGAQANGLGVAAPFEVKDAVFAPAVFIIADEFALRVGGAAGLAGHVAAR